MMRMMGKLAVREEQRALIIVQLTETSRTG